jgi:hypothetical protein
MGGEWFVGLEKALYMFSYNLIFEKIAIKNGMLVAHTCNPSYSGGREQED